MANDQEVANGTLGSYRVLVDKTSDLNERQAVGIDIGTVSGGVLTPSRVSLANPLPVAIVSSSSSLVTYAHTRPSLPNNTNTQVVAANVNRKAGSYLVNNTTQTFWLQYGAAAVLNQGVFLDPGGVFKFDTTQEIRAIQNSGGALSLDCFEAT